MHNTNEGAGSFKVSDAKDIYAIRKWGEPYFDVNDAGHVVVYPMGGNKNPAYSIDLKALVDELQERGIPSPLLIRFPEILRSRIVKLNETFRSVMTQFGYRGEYKGVYPIKVNQDRFVVEHIASYGRPYHYGLEAGSKPELLAVIALLEDENALIICNGYKDEEYIETALLASKLGRNIFLVVEKPSELALIATISKRLGIKPKIGIRVKLSARGSGRWESSGGDQSKFGLSSREILDALAFLKEHDLLSQLELLHFHLGSQISAIQSIRTGIQEAARFFTELYKAGAPLKYMDIGGGLGIDYDGSQSQDSFSTNYSVQDYVRDVVYHLKQICDEDNVPHPTLISESGRAVVAHHAVLVIDVLGVSEFRLRPQEVPSKDALPAVQKLWTLYQDLRTENSIPTYEEASRCKQECVTSFAKGETSLEERALAEELFWGICQKILQIHPKVPEELEKLRQTLSDTYFCNFSVFQSLPDSWAINQLFPIMPIHRLNEKPTQAGLLADITCDSDGKIDQFVAQKGAKSVLELHPLTGENYYLGIFMVGAYQEILGDLHNLLGNTNAVLVFNDGEGGYQIEHVVPGDTVASVLEYVDYSGDELRARVRRAAEVAVRNRKMTLEETKILLRFYEQGLFGYTYLERD